MTMNAAMEAMKRRAAHLGAHIERDREMISIYSPDGTCWAHSGDHIICYSAEPGEPISDPIANALDDMESGVEPCFCEECSEWRGENG